MTRKIANSQQSLEQLITYLRNAWERAKYLGVSIDECKRTIDQNALQFHWYKEIAQQADDVGVYVGETPLTLQRLCKYKFGLAIRCRGDDFFRDMMLCLCEKYKNLEQRHELMDDIEVTRKFKVSEMNEYLTEIQLHFSAKGFILTNSEDFKR